jgi:hypothetical protein
MSTLWNVEVIELSGSKVKLRIVCAHPDAGRFGKDAVFALRVLHEPATEFNENFQTVGVGPLGDAVDDDRILSESWAKENAPKYVASVTVDEPDDLPEMVPVDTVATYDIETTDPKWLEHLSEGQRWRSAAFS